MTLGGRIFDFSPTAAHSPRIARIPLGRGSTARIGLLAIRAMILAESVLSTLTTLMPCDLALLECGCSANPSDSVLCDEQAQAQWIGARQSDKAIFSLRPPASVRSLPCSPPKWSMLNLLRN